MRHFFLLLFGSTIFLSACSRDFKSDSPVTAISADGKVQFADGSSHEIPGFNATNSIVIFAIRHVEKEQDGTDDPKISLEGHNRAEKLGKLIKDVRFNRIAYSNLRRNMMTMEILSYFTGAPDGDIFPPDGWEDWLNKLVQNPGGTKHIYIGHSNTLPKLLNKLTGKTTYQNLDDNEYDRLYIITTRGLGNSDVMELRY